MIQDRDDDDALLIEEVPQDVPQDIPPVPQYVKEHLENLPYFFC